MGRRIDLYFSMMSPWAHLGHEPFMAIAHRHGLEIAWRPTPLLTLFAATGGAPLAKRAIQRQRYRMVELQRWAQLRGRPINLRPKHWPFDPSLADRTTIAIAAMGKDATGFAAAGMRGVWEEERDLAARATLSELLAAEGLDAEAVLAAADAPETASAYDQHARDAEAAGVFGSPAYLLDGEVFWGQDRLDLLDHALASGRPPYRADV